MAKTLTDRMVETAATAGVRRIYGIIGDGLHGFTDTLRQLCPLVTPAGSTSLPLREYWHAR